MLSGNLVWIITVMTGSVVPAVESHADVVLVASAHHAFEALVEFMRIMPADALHPHLAAVLAYLLRLSDELSFLSALRARLHCVHILRKVESSNGHNQSVQRTCARSRFLCFGRQRRAHVADFCVLSKHTLQMGDGDVRILRLHFCFLGQLLFLAARVIFVTIFGIGGSFAAQSHCPCYGLCNRHRLRTSRWCATFGRGFILCVFGAHWRSLGCTA